MHRRGIRMPTLQTFKASQRQKHKLMMPKNILDVDNSSSNSKQRFDNVATHYESSSWLCA